MKKKNENEWMLINWSWFGCSGAVVILIVVVVVVADHQQLMSWSLPHCLDLVDLATPT